MANLQEKRQKIQSTTNTAKITKAMEMVSAVKLRKYNEAAVNSKEYMDALKEMISDATKGYTEQGIALLQKKIVEKKSLIIFIGTTRGLVGALINRLESTLAGFVKDLNSKKIDFDIITLKRKSIDVPVKLGLEVKNHFSENFENSSISEITPLKSLILDGYNNGEYDSVYLLYTRFVNAFSQVPTITKLLPFESPSSRSIGTSAEQEIANDSFMFESDQREIIEGLVENYLEAFIGHALLNATTSEYSARMVAMKQATDSAKEIEKNLKLEYNKERQAQITMQLQESIKIINN